VSRLALVVALVVAPQLAEAHRSCREESAIVGYELCSRFGSRWSGFATVWWEFGVAALRFDPKPLDHATALDDRPISAVGGRFRWLAGIGRTWFFGTELTVASVTGGPRLVANAVARDATTTMDTATAGLVAQPEFVVGAHRTYGLVTLGTTVGVGGRVALLDPNLAPAWFVLDGHAKADVWISPNVTLGVDASIDVLRSGDYTVGLSLGLHLLPYDRTR
jgi:hypothetical protein